MVDPAVGFSGSGLDSTHCCILFSTADWDEPYWTNKQHTARELAARGWLVLYIESVGFRSPRVASQRDWKRLRRRLVRGVAALLLGPRQRSENVWVLPPLTFPAKNHWPFVKWLNRLLLSGTIRRFIARYEFSTPLIWTYHPYLRGAVDGLDRRGLVYHCVDDISAVPGVDVNLFLECERALLGDCDVVFVTAKALQERCEAVNPHTYFYGNVVDDAHFGNARAERALPEDIRSIPEPRLVYHGVLSDFKLDFGLILIAVRARPQWQWVFIGEEREGQRNEAIQSLKRLPNVHFLGYRSYQVLPDYLRGMAVGLLPTLLNDYTRSMFPMKYFEYLAAGLPVVSTPLAFTEHETQGLAVGADAAGFVDAIEIQLARGRLSDSEVRTFVGDNTWRGRTQKMLDIVDRELGAQHGRE